MFSRNIIKKLAVISLLLSISVMVFTGCGKRVGKNLDDITDDNNPPTQQPDNNSTQPRDNDPVDVPIDEGDNVNFLNINLVGGDPPLQRNEGIFYFTKTQHPPEVEKSFRYDSHNGWLIQLDDPLYKGNKLKVQRIKRTGNIYDITVKLEAGGDFTKPAFGFFEVGIFDMPTSAQFRIYNDSGKKLWPKF